MFVFKMAPSVTLTLALLKAKLLVTDMNETTQSWGTLGDKVLTLRGY